ncbi:MAG: hypothetical protein M3133_05850 [Actinomycetota bacterium]|nr:hypothetical protein [Actinomycetota bacterium]
MRKSIATLVSAPLVVLLMTVSPTSAQPSSPGGQPGAEEAPAPEGPSVTRGVNTGGEDEGGNRTTPGGAGAEGNAPGDRSTGPSLGGGLALLAVLAVAGLGAVMLIRRRSRRAEEQLQT